MKFNSCLWTIIAGLAIVGCAKEASIEKAPEKAKRQITVITRTPETRLTLDDEHNALKWTATDNIRIMTNTTDATANHDATTLSYSADGVFTVGVSDDASVAYAYYKAGTFDDEDHSDPAAYSAYITAPQTQTEAGVFNGEWLPMAAKGTINSDNTVSLDFHPMAGVLALNIYSSAKVAGEKIKKVTVTPTANTKFCGLKAGADLTAENAIYAEGTSTSHSSVSVTLETAYDYASAKPTDKRLFDKQIYVVLAKQTYKSVKFEIETEAGEKYELISSATKGIDLENNDFYPINIDLNGHKVVAYEESFNEDQGLFTTEGTEGTWSHGTYSGEGYMKAQKANNATGWLISPVLTINTSDAKLSFEQSISKYTTNASQEYTVWIREVGGNWEQLTGFDYPAIPTDKSFSDFEPAEVALSKNGKNIQIGFKYISTDTYGSWEIKNFRVTDASLVQPLDFSVTTASPIEVPAEPEDFYEITVEADNAVSWTAEVIEGDASAIELSATEFTGSGTVELMIDDNDGAARSWKIKISTDAYVLTPSYTILITQAGTSGGAIDILDREFTGVPLASNYVAWLNKVGVSGAVYAGNSAGTNNTIQLRTNNSNSGIVTTGSGGYVKKVTVTWNSSTAAGRKLNVYGKNAAYSDVSDLYGNNAGTLIGTIDFGADNSPSLDITTDYQFIGIRSASAALYLDEIQIEWSSTPAPPAPVITLSNTPTQNIAATGGTVSFNYEIANPVQGVSVQASAGDATWVKDFNYSVAGVISFTVEPKTTTGTRTAVITVNYTGADSKTFSITQEGAAPSGDDPVTANFIFNTDAGIAALGIEKPATSAGTSLEGPYTVDGVTMTVGHGSTETRIWNSKGTLDLRMYKNGGALTFSVAEGKVITSIVVTGSSTGNISASSGSYESGTWSGSAQTVTLSAANTCNINSIAVTYE